MHDELVAAIPERRAAAANDLLNRCRDQVEASVSFLMPATIVDPLKSIEVEEYQSDQLTILKGLVKPAFKLTPSR